VKRTGTSLPANFAHLTEMHPDVALSRLREGAINVAVVFRYDDMASDDMQIMPSLRAILADRHRRYGVSHAHRVQR
jgi:hypothetical protein